MRRRWRVLGLAAGALALLGVAVLAAVLARGPDGRVLIGPLLDAGGSGLVSALVFTGWLVGRFPLLAAVVLAGGVTRELADETSTEPWRWAAPLAVTMASAFALGTGLLPVFDLVLLGAWGGLATPVYVAAQVLVFGALTAFISLWTRWDGWFALLLAAAAMGWHYLAETGLGPDWPILGDLVSFLLPPQRALVALEEAFAGVQPIPWPAFAYAVGYAAALLLITALVLRRRSGTGGR